MRIGIMLRELDARGGVSVYAENMTRELLAIDRRNTYVLFYRSAEHVGRFGRYPNVTERVVEAPAALPLSQGKYSVNLWDPIWDQLQIPLACLRERIDVLFHPKFTVPLLAPCKTVMVVHGADWFVPEQAKFYGDFDVRQIRAVMPWYFRKASLVLSVSRLTTENFIAALGTAPEKIRTVYFGPAKHFRPVQDAAELARVRERYGLPERFILTLSKYGGGGRKNFGNLVEAYRLHRERHADGPALVVGGRGCEGFRADYGIPHEGYGADVLFPGWIDQADLPAVLSQALLYLYPSNLEAFPIPLTEAMTCGTPVVTSDVNGLEEIAGDAGLRVDPEDPAAIAAAIGRVVADPGLRSELSRRGIERARRFTWQRCGRETLELLEAVGRSDRRGLASCASDAA
jgi:glycosyltransferase involved in cell wall biosynthesis